jgi:hypothetical protein
LLDQAEGGEGDADFGEDTAAQFIKIFSRCGLW